MTPTSKSFNTSFLKTSYIVEFSLCWCSTETLYSSSIKISCMQRDGLILLISEIVNPIAFLRSQSTLNSWSSSISMRIFKIIMRNEFFSPNMHIAGDWATVWAQVLEVVEQMVKVFGTITELHPWLLEEWRYGYLASYRFFYFLFFMANTESTPNKPQKVTGVIKSICFYHRIFDYIYIYESCSLQNLNALNTLIINSSSSNINIS